MVWPGRTRDATRPFARTSAISDRDGPDGSIQTAPLIAQPRTAHEILVLRSPACHLCEDALDALAGLAARFPMSVRVVEAESEEGRELQRQHRPSMSPAVFADGSLFSVGRLPRRKLVRLLEQDR